MGKGEPNGTFYVHRRNSSSRNNLIQSSLSRVRGSKNTTGMGGVKGNTAVAHVTMDNVTAITGSSARKRKTAVRADCNA